MGKQAQRQIRVLEDCIDQLSDMVEKAIKESMRCLFAKDLAGARIVIDNDNAINALRYEIEDLCVSLIATQQPVARDAREVICVLYIIVDLERMGDYAEGIGRVTLQLPEDVDFAPYQELKEIFEAMTEKSCRMLEKSMETFFARDVDGAKEICFSDEEVDALYRKACNYIFACTNCHIDILTRFSWIAHNLERIADRTTNIAERTAFLVTGKMEEIGSSKY